MKVNLHLVEALLISFLLTGGSLWSFTTQASALKSPLPLELPDQPIQLPPHYLISSSQIFTYYNYLPLISKPFFDLVSFPVTGPGFAVPAVDERYIYAGSGFGNYCENTGQVRAFDKETLSLIWKTNVVGSIGDTTLTLANNQVIFGAGDGVAAIRTSDGRLVWQRHLEGCFQESFIRLHQGRIYVGSTTGYVYSITTQGQVVWRNRLPGSVFAAPAIAGNTVYFVDMTNRLTALNLITGQIRWQKKLPLTPGQRSGIFASPYFYDNSLFIATYSGHIWRVSPAGQIEAQYSSSDRYVSSPTVCNGELVVANLAGRIDWLEIADLQLHHTLNITEPYVFGTPQCLNNVIIATGYGIETVASALYYLNQGQILSRFEFPCCKAALTTTVIDGFNVYNVLTTFNLHEEVELARSKAVLSPQVLSFKPDQSKSIGKQ